MQIAEITRQAPLISTGFPEELARKAAKLGYTRLAVAAKPLAAILATLAILPFRTDLVKKYEASKVMIGIWRRTKRSIQCVVIAALMACVAISLARYAGHVVGFWPSFFVGLASVVFAVTAFGFFMGKGLEGDSRIVRRWNTCRLADYEGIVPIPVLERAIAIVDEASKRGLEVFVEVEHLMENHEVIPDPFLKVRRHDEVYYIDVWEEEVPYENFL